MNLTKTGFRFFRVLADEDCPMSPDGARRLCDAVAQIKEDQWRMKLLIVYIAAVLTFTNGGDILNAVFRVFIG